VIDVDVLLLDGVEYESDRLTLPHPEVRSRRFVLVPLLELDPDPALAEALEALGDGQAVRRVAGRAGGPLM
jgi:2-amino-4-hydroxy-6-hydroxymethyldihydropteridine diphosphokinase